MPTVRRVEQNEVQQAALPGVRVSSGASLDAFGGGSSLEGVTRAAQGITSEMETIADRERRKADDAATTKFYTDLARKKQDLFWNPQQGVVTKKGQDSFTALETYGAEFDKYADDLEKGLATEEQRQTARQIRSKEKLEFDGQIQRHIYGESKQFEDQTQKAGIDVARNDAVLNYSDPAKIADSIKLQEALVMQGAEGKPAALVQMEVQNVRSKTHADVIKRMLTNNQDLEAKSYFEANKASITDKDDLVGVESAIMAGYTRGEAQRQAGTITDKYGSDLRGALAAAREIKDPDVQAATVAEVKSRHAENETIKKDNEEKRFMGALNNLEQTKTLPDAVTWSKLPLPERKALEDRLHHLRAGVEPSTDWGKFYELKTLASSPETRTEFLRYNLGTYRNQLADAEFKELINLQASIRKKDGKAELALDGFRSDKMIVDQTLNAAGVDTKDAAKVASFYRQVDEQVRVVQANTGKKATNDEIQRIADNLVVKGTVAGSGVLGFFKTNRYAFEKQTGEELELTAASVPKGERAMIESALKARNLPVTDAEILKLYTRKISGMAGPRGK